MPRRCTVCVHPDRKAIDVALIDGTAVSTLSNAYGLGYESLRRHRDNHLPASLVRGHQAVEVIEADTLLDRLRWLGQRALRSLDEAERAGGHAARAAYLRECRGCLELEARMLGTLPPAVLIAMGVNIVQAESSVTEVRVIYEDAFPSIDAKETP